jgi:uncharacterized protein DUF3857/transglutaminase superfamily protein
MRSRWSWCAVSLLRAVLAVLAMLAAGPAAAVTIVERSVDVELRPDGSTLEREKLVVRLDTAADVSSWSRYPVYFDEHRKIEQLAASVRRPDGSTSTVSRRDLDTVESAGEGLHSSEKFRVITFPAVPPGSVLTVESLVSDRPYFRAARLPLARLPLGDSEPIERLRVTVHGGGAGWRWRIDGPRDGLTVAEVPGGVTIAGTSLPALRPPDLAPAAAARGAVLRYGWGEPVGWADIGRWYEGLLATVPRAAEPVRATARELTAGVAGKRERLAALLAFLRRQVRYVAVEVGVGGYRPAPPQAVLERRWGDCKDKALLLVDLLREAGIEAHPALVLSADDDRVDVEFPSPNQFNHVIVAVPADGVEAPGDPVGGGFLFVDPTQEKGGLRWLHPGMQDQHALVVRGAESALVRIPIHEELEERQLEVDLAVTPAGDAQGTARLALSGELGSIFLERFGASRPEEIEREVRTAFSHLLPGGELSQVQWTAADVDVPAVTLSTRVRFAGLVAGDGGDGAARSFALPAPVATPAPGLLQDRTLPVLLGPVSDHLTWHIDLPAGWCPPRPEEPAVENALGEFRQTMAFKDHRLTLERRTRLAQHWVEPSSFAALKELSLADHKANKRRIRLDCGEAVAGGVKP